MPTLLEIATAAAAQSGDDGNTNNFDTADSLTTPKGKAPNQFNPIPRTAALARAVDAIVEFNQDQDSKLVNHGVDEPVKPDHVKAIQKAEAKKQELYLDYLYAKYFQMPVNEPLSTDAPDSPQAAIAAAAEAEAARIRKVDADPIPAKAAYTAEHRKMIANAIHAATDDFYRKYVAEKYLPEFHAMRAYFFKISKSSIEVENKVGRWTIKPIDKDTPSQSIRAAQSVGRQIKAEKEAEKKAKDEAEEDEIKTRFEVGLTINHNPAAETHYERLAALAKAEHEAKVQARARLQAATEAQNPASGGGQGAGEERDDAESNNSGYASTG